jgi:hypothetical protein
MCSTECLLVEYMQIVCKKLSTSLGHKEYMKCKLFDEITQPETTYICTKIIIFQPSTSGDITGEHDPDHDDD